MAAMEDEKDLKAWKKIGPVLVDLVAQLQAERDDARSAARALWMNWSFREKEESNPGLAHELRDTCPWLKDD